jgi:23S rRNA pseudouridine1911/1915/1917 synthase
MSGQQQVHLTLDAPGERLDKALGDALPQLSRVQWQRLLKEERVLLDGQLVTKASLRLVGGEQVVATLAEPVETDIIPDDIPLDIRYEDDDILVVNKPAGMVVHLGTGHVRGTLVNAVLAHCPDVLGVGGEVRPGIVHRLDKETSGLIVVAKHDVALRVMQAQFQARDVKKVYLALVEGRIRPPQAVIDAPIGRHVGHRKRMQVVVDPARESRPAQTTYYTQTVYEHHTLVACHPLTGRTHQIRVHMAYLGFPIVGDKVYGRRKQKLGLNRQFLHAAQLTFKRPFDNQLLTLTAELPSELQAILDKLPAVAYAAELTDY